VEPTVACHEARFSPPTEVAQEEYLIRSIAACGRLFVVETEYVSTPS